MKSQLEEKINKLIWTGKLSEYEFIIIHRGAPNDEKIISGEEIVAFKNRFLILKSGMCIPTHRIKEIRKFSD